MHACQDARYTLLYVNKKNRSIQTGRASCVTRYFRRRGFVKDDRKINRPSRFRLSFTKVATVSTASLVMLIGMQERTAGEEDTRGRDQSHFEERGDLPKLDADPNLTAFFDSMASCVVMAPSDIEAFEFNPEDPEFIAARQRNLMTIGFDLGPWRDDGDKGGQTDAAISSFRVLYGNNIEAMFGGSDDAAEGFDLVTSLAMQKFAEQAERDAEEYGLKKRRTGSIAGIRLASLRIGLDFEYMMDVAWIESNKTFRSTIKSPYSSATGLYQFINQTWLMMIKEHGHKYGLEDLADHIKIRTNSRGHPYASVRNGLIRQQILDLRKVPHLNALMAAEFTLGHKQAFTGEFGRDPNYTELYMMHFLGKDGGMNFIKQKEETPDGIAANTFSSAAASNPHGFYDPQGNAFTFRQIYDNVTAKIEHDRFHKPEYEAEVAKQFVASGQTERPPGCVARLPSYRAPGQGPG